ncbi:unnamed protein product, partial [Ectocarpus sp. 8 AP-2014]
MKCTVCHVHSFISDDDVFFFFCCLPSFFLSCSPPRLHVIFSWLLTLPLSGWLTVSFGVALLPSSPSSSVVPSWNCFFRDKLSKQPYKKKSKKAAERRGVGLVGTFHAAEVEVEVACCGKRF